MVGPYQPPFGLCVNREVQDRFLAGLFVAPGELTGAYQHLEICEERLFVLTTSFPEIVAN